MLIQLDRAHLRRNETYSQPADGGKPITVTGNGHEGKTANDLTVNTLPPASDITSMEVTTQPNLDYNDGDPLDLSDIVVKICYQNGYCTDLTGPDELANAGIVTDPADGDILTTADDGPSITISTGNEVSTTTDPLIVTPKALATIDSITVITQPDDLTYTDGDALDLTGLVVYSDNTCADLDPDDLAAVGITTGPAEGSTLTTADNGTSITITGDGITTTADPLTVVPRGGGGGAPMPVQPIPASSPVTLLLMAMFILLFGGAVAGRRELARWRR
ncbi:MAG: hypothetical protein LBB65_06005 [Burkholderiales bacterium]|nr:hypothetical protein [Burkholderiales bacterium]